MLQRAVRTVVQMLLAWLFCLVYLPLMGLLLAATLGRKKATLGAKLTRGWGKGMLRIAGVRLDVDPDVQAELAERRARVLTFNHSSTLDLFVGAALSPEGAVTIVKKEMRYVPLIGQVLFLIDVVCIDRSNRAGAAASLQAVADRLRTGRHSVMIAPEGTRSADGQLGPFKMGPFHLAVAAQVPIVPLVMHDCARLYPRTAWHSDPGVVRVSKLPEIATAGRSADEVHRLASDLRAAYLEALQ
jgi:putative phosphoserine phosphatase/1-acylglycerol-3-phosphate O-acyltransferase